MGAMNRVNSSKLTSVDDMGRYLESPGLRGVRGSIWNYFFFSLLLGDNINWGGGPQFWESRVSFDEGHFYTKNGTQWIKTEPIRQKLCPTTQGGIY